MSHGTHTHWRMTINNYDATDLALIQQGYPDQIRQLVYTLEEGEEGTPHIQAYIKMKRDTRFSAMRKLFPRGNFNFIDNDEYKLNSQRYAQKLDSTARSPAVISNFDPLHTIEGTIRRVMRRIYTEMVYYDYSRKNLWDFRKMIEKKMVQEDYTMAKVFVSSTYKQMWEHFGEAMYSNLVPQFEVEDREEVASRLESVHTHTHTHSDEKFSHEGGITTNADEGEDSQEDSGSVDGQSEEDSEGDEDSEGSESEASDESDDSGCSESDAESED